MQVDLLSKLARTKKKGHNLTVIQETLHRLSIELGESFSTEDGDREWMEHVWQYLTHGKLPDEDGEAKRVRRQASFYTIKDGQLYRRGFSTLILKCITTSQAESVMAEMHEGICGMHMSGPILAIKVLNAGY